MLSTFLCLISNFRRFPGKFLNIVFFGNLSTVASESDTHIARVAWDCHFVSSETNRNMYGLPLQSYVC